MSNQDETAKEAFKKAKGITFAIREHEVRLRKLEKKQNNWIRNMWAQLFFNLAVLFAFLGMWGMLP